MLMKCLLEAKQSFMPGYQRKKKIKEGPGLKLGVSVHPFNKYVWRTCCVAGTVLSSGSPQELKQAKPLPSRSLNSIAGSQTNKT